MYFFPTILLGAFVSRTKVRISFGELSLKSARIALTREEGNNDKMMQLLENCDCYEIPCIMFGPGEDSERLKSDLYTHDIVTVTSPQGAAVLISAWIAAGKPSIKVATVGRGTSKCLLKEGIVPIFEPSDFTAKTLGAELPASEGLRVLYPTSTLAEDTLQSILEGRGFQVTRLNTYDTVPSIWSDEMRELAKSMDIVTFASPSAIRIWKERVGSDYVAVVIGPTSAAAAKKADFREVVSPEGSKGIEAWASLVSTTADKFNYKK